MGRVIDDTLPTKISESIGDGESKTIKVYHPAAPNVVAMVYRVKTGQAVAVLPQMNRGYVVFHFPNAPDRDEFVATVVG